MKRVWWFGLEFIAYTIMSKPPNRFNIWSYDVRLRCVNCDWLCGIGPNKSDYRSESGLNICPECGADGTHMKPWVGYQFAGKATWVPPELLPESLRPSDLELLATASRSKE